MSLQHSVYVIRLTCTLMILALLVAHGALCHGQAGKHGWLLAAGLLYPHAGNLLFGRQDIGRRGGQAVFLADGLFAGAVIAALGFAPAPALVLLVINLFNWMVVGGPLLVLLGGVFLTVGLLATGTGSEFSWRPDLHPCPSADWIAALIALVYFSLVARIIHRLLSELRLRQIEIQARSDSAGSARVMAERALLAVLPRSAASTLEASGRLPDEEVRKAALLLLELEGADGSTPPIADLKDALATCEPILERHGLELIKTFGRRAIVMGRGDGGVEKAFGAFLEIGAHFGAQGNLAAAGHDGIRLHAALHQGDACLGLVQPARLNLDLAGIALDELLCLADAPAGRQGPGLIVSPAAYRQLSNPAGLLAADGPAAGHPRFYFYPTGRQA